MSKVGIVGDLHLPFTHPLYLDFCQDVFEAWDVDTVHLIGDVIDHHALGFWEHDPDGESASDEATRAHDGLRDWVKAFPAARVSIGNHDERHYRRAKRDGMPARYLRTYADVWDTPGWTWENSTVIDGVLYEHGTGTSGKGAAINRALAKRNSLVMGHTHTHAGVTWHANEFNRIFGLQVGCGIDLTGYAFHYSKPWPIRPIMGCGIVTDGDMAVFEVMPCGAGEQYHRSHS